LSNIVEVDQRQHLHPEKLHSLLLQELQPLEEVTALSPEELLAELQALQLAAERGWDLGDTPVKDKCLGAHTEELLVQHVSGTAHP
jgi:hypothetical protein